MGGFGNAVELSEGLVLLQPGVAAKCCGVFVLSFGRVDRVSENVSHVFFLTPRWRTCARLNVVGELRLNAVVTKAAFSEVSVSRLCTHPFTVHSWLCLLPRLVYFVCLVIFSCSLDFCCSARRCSICFSLFPLFSSCVCLLVHQWVFCE